MGPSVMRSPAASSRPPLAPRWHDTGLAGLDFSAEIKYAFLPCVISTSGRLHGEFLRLLYIIAHRRTTRWFQRHSNDEPSEDAFKFRRGQYFWHTRAAIGQAAARAVAQRVHVAEHTLRRHRVPSNVQDDLAYPATVH